MNTRTRGLALIPGLALVLAVPLLGAPAASAAETDISVTYSTQNNANAAIDGSTTVHGRVGQTRDDMRVTYTIKSDTVKYPIPVLTYTGDFTDSSDATYTFRFGCDATVPGSDCAGYQYQVDAMNAVAATLDGRSISGFTADVTPIIMTFGGDVPPGITGTVTASVNSSVPGTGQLEFFLQEGQQAGAERLSPTAVTPLSITRPELAAKSASSFCAADLAEHVEGTTKYTPTGFGRSTFDVSATVTDAGILPDDTTAVGTDPAALRFSVQNGATNLTEAQLETTLLAAAPGTYQVAGSYTAPDGVAAPGISTGVTVLGADAAECWSTSEVKPPVTPKPEKPKPTPTAPAPELAKTGADGQNALLAGGAGIGLLGAALIAGALVRRRAI
ncbi:hypothetical protein BMH32_01445 [Leucobacter sp. OLJS4]|uniref:LPXTG cell wall anchor domain-containing protein n=1 Tax=unclassified Leucobacter TaxID=2621730 RepID=UPI000C192616|nr:MULTISPECIES: LPXTG cell wall anchor domain-containing protein [unclassified Leucobacter]PII82452.1 hypothetical protein BMH25_11335 [Leucobacter sp. OLCALW19]PII87368.1 hypothetical protein BMH26_09460 [Leucobacter sp. OLTLW20]PII94576.1 hypothetical protein BMH27_00940 [Leucobacter sp. OLAS13]PIJ00626.1 hypothetical protein BMH29_00575 [Leucobacter sp. OLDS2]PIJ03111.1 hypothetical protein BMH28_03310 [Leucobacter sp. OLCS4]